MNLNRQSTGEVRKMDLLRSTHPPGCLALPLKPPSKDYKYKPCPTACNAKYETTENFVKRM